MISVDFPVGIAAFDIGAVVGPYEILRTLGRGGMGVVFRAQHRHTGKLVALKTVRTANPLLLTSIRREVQRLRRLSHPGVVRILDDGVHESLPWYTMDLYDCATWDELFEKRRTSSVLVHSQGAKQQADTAAYDPAQAIKEPPTQSTAAVHVCEQLPPLAPDALPELLRRTHRLCDTLAYIHGEGVVHRDVKPGNVFLPETDRTVLVDFGLVVAFAGPDGREVLQLAPSLVGTVAYMSPEQLSGDIVDARSDLFALGCMLYETITGRLPFPATRQERLASFGSPPLPPSDFAPFVPPVLDSLILKLLATDRRHRIGHASDVCAALTSSLFVSLPPQTESSPPSRDYLYRPRLAGREDIVSELMQHVEQLSRGHGELILLEGESGCGKTRLLTELVRRAQLTGVMVQIGECQPKGVARPGEAALQAGPLSPLRPLLQMIGDLCRTEGTATTQELLGPRLRVLAAIEPSLAALPGANEQPDVQSLPADAARQRVLGAVVDTLTLLSRRGAMVLLLDDLQWADDLTMALLTLVGTDLVAKVPLLVIGSYRSDERSAGLESLCTTPHVSTRTIGRLTEAHVGSMIADMLAVQAAPQDLVRFVAEQAVGNPFFVTEYLHTAVGEGLLRRNRHGGWELVDRATDNALPWRARLTALGLPGTLRAMIERRFSRLSPTLRTLLLQAAVLGKEFDGELLRVTSGQDERTHADALNELLLQQFFEPAGENRYRFCHDKLREVAYELISVEQRRRLHLVAAEKLELAATASPDLLQLANHYTVAEVPDKARHYLSLAAKVLTQTGAFHQAAPLIVRSISFAESPSSPARAEELGQLYFQRGETLFALGDTKQAAQDAERALALFGIRFDLETARNAAAFVVQLGKQLARFVGLRRPRTPPVEGELAADVSDLAARAASLLCICYFADSRPPLQTMTATLLAANLAEDAGPNTPRSIPYATLGYTAGILRLWRLSQRYFAEAHAHAIAQNAPASQAQVGILECAFYNGSAEWDSMSATYQTALAVASRNRDPLSRQALQLIAAGEALLTGKLAAAAELLTEVRHTAQTSRNRLNQGWGSAMLAAHALLCGELTRSDELAHEALHLFENDPGNAAANALAVRATVALLRGQSNSAYQFAQEALSVLSRGPVMFQMWQTCDFLPQTLLSLWDQARQNQESSEPALRGLCSLAIEKAQSLAFLFPIGQPLSLRAEGVRARIDQKPRPARRLLRQSQHIAQQLRMPIAQLAASIELARCETDRGPQSALAKTAHEQALSIGCVYWADQAKAML